MHAGLLIVLGHGVQQLEDCRLELFSEKPALYPAAFRDLVANEVNLALASGDQEPLVSSTILCATALGTAHWFGLFDLVAAAVEEMGVRSGVQRAVEARIDIESYRGVGAEYVHHRLFLEHRPVSSAGWIRLLSGQSPVYRFNPMASMPEEMVMPEADKPQGADVLDVDLNRVRIGLLPIPSGRDCRIAAFMETLENSRQFGQAAAFMTPEREEVALLFARRRTVHVARGGEDLQLKSAFVAACLPAPTGPYDPAQRELAIALHVAKRCGCDMEPVTAAVLSLLDAERGRRLRLLLDTRIPLLDVAGVREVTGPEGVEFA